METTGRGGNEVERTAGRRVSPIDPQTNQRQSRRDREFGSARPPSDPVVLPPGAAEYLVATNPRLEELSTRYAAIRSAATQHTRWSDEYVSADVPLTRFRDDCAYVWQRRAGNRPATYALTYYYLKASRQHWRLLRRLGEDQLFGAYTVEIDRRLVSRDLLDSVSEIAFLERHCPEIHRPGAQVLDIGSGYGRLAHRLVTAINGVKVLCVDAIARSTFVCEYYLSQRGVTDRTSVIPCDVIDESLKGRNIAVATNVHSFSECGAATVDWWLATLRRYEVRNLMVVPNLRRASQTPITGVEANGEYSDLMPVFEANGYALAAAELKYADPAVQVAGVSPSLYYLFRLLAPEGTR